MLCARCGGKLPSDSVNCPVCGLCNIPEVYQSEKVKIRKRNAAKPKSILFVFSIFLAVVLNLYYIFQQTVRLLVLVIPPFSYQNIPGCIVYASSILFCISALALLYFLYRYDRWARLLYIWCSGLFALTEMIVGNTATVLVQIALLVLLFGQDWSKFE